MQDRPFFERLSPPPLRWFLVLASLLCAFGCEQILGTDFDRRYVTASTCVPRCDEGMRCNATTLKCECAPLEVCEPGVCGALIEPRCGQPIDCGGCASGQFCGSETPNTCSATPCTPQTCEALGQTSGVHATCGILVDCNPAPSCNCAPGQVCTTNGCCDPFEHHEFACGPLNDGCGRVENVQCDTNSELTCGENNTCCAQSIACKEPGTTCGINVKCGLLMNCDGSCPEGQTCNYDASQAHHYCGECAPRCPAAPTCGLNDDVGCPGQTIACDGACPEGEVCLASPFRCCRPACPATPTVCGASDDGCGGTIQCPGPCAPGLTCRSDNAGNFACSQ